MRVPSPDESLVLLAERAMRPFQLRGIPLPAIRAPLGFVEPAGGVATAAMFLKLAYEPMIGLMGFVFLVMAGVDAMTAMVQHRRLTALARSWGPDAAARYGREVLEARETRAPMRMMLVATSACALAVALLAFRTATPLYVLGGIGFAAMAVGRLAVAYAACVFPEDPGMGRRAPVPAGA